MTPPDIRSRAASSRRGGTTCWQDAPFDPGRRIDVLQGLKDTDVPPAHARALKDLLPGDCVHITEVPDGDHRLAREEDLARLYRLIEGQLCSD